MFKFGSVKKYFALHFEDDGHFAPNRSSAISFASNLATIGAPPVKGSDIGAFWNEQKMIAPQ
jgi:hypothetical protein